MNGDRHDARRHGCVDGGVKAKHKATGRVRNRGLNSQPELVPLFNKLEQLLEAHARCKGGGDGYSAATLAMATYAITEPT